MCAKASCRAGSTETDEEDLIMTIPAELEARILRYYHVEKWRIGTIARQLRVHPETVARVLAQAGLPRIGAPRRPSKIDPYLPFIREMLARFPTLTASRLHAMVCERGYRGGQSRFRAVIACHRPRPPAEAYLRLRTLPGEQAQCDWALCRARHRAHYADKRTMPGPVLQHDLFRVPSGLFEVTALKSSA
jgi:hypothetical protein